MTARSALTERQHGEPAQDVNRLHRHGDLVDLMFDELPQVEVKLLRYLGNEQSCHYTLQFMQRQRARGGRLAQRRRAAFAAAALFTGHGGLACPRR